MATELADGVHALDLTVDRGDRTATFHPAAVETPRGVILLDTGLPGTEGLLGEELDDAGLSFEDVRIVLLTHQDSDHAGSTATVADRTGALVAAHGEAAPYVDGREHPLKSGDGERYPPVAVDVELVDGVRFRTDAGPMDVVFTPGHAPGHVSLFLPDERLLLAADAMTAADGLQGPSSEYTLDPAEAARSVGRLAELDVARTLCFHGGFVEQGRERIAAIHDELTD